MPSDIDTSYPFFDNRQARCPKCGEKWQPDELREGFNDRCCPYCEYEVELYVVTTIEIKSPPLLKKDRKATP